MFLLLNCLTCDLGHKLTSPYNLKLSNDDGTHLLVGFTMYILCISLSKWQFSRRSYAKK